MGNSREEQHLTSPPASMAPATVKPSTENGEFLGENNQYADKYDFAAEKCLAQKLGVGFDGRRYVYLAYRYDLLSDAIAYARLNRAGPDYREEPQAVMPWLDPKFPTAAELILMEELAIYFDGRRYHYGDYLYEDAGDAVNYARLDRD